MNAAGSDLERMLEIAQAAGRAVMQVYAAGGWVQAKADASPLTEADLRADTVIRNALAASFPGVAVVSEESAPAQGDDGSGGAAGAAGAASKGAYFLVDPLDGTREFLLRNGEFTVNIALVDGDAAIAGAVVAPALRQSYFAARGRGAWRADAAGSVPLRVRQRDAGAPLRIIASRSHGSGPLEARLASLAVPYELVTAGSSLKFCRVAEGAADIYPRLAPTSQWDTAAAQCVLECAGGLVWGSDGQPLRYGRGRPLRNPLFVAMADASLFHLFA
jgi:3'(2'),5'-bisphosphate nucleotidase